jgi:hypothetical protein
VRFVQIAVTNNTYDGDALYALDENGRVWVMTDARNARHLTGSEQAAAWDAILPPQSSSEALRAAEGVAP